MERPERATARQELVGTRSVGHRALTDERDDGVDLRVDGLDLRQVGGHHFAC